MIPDQRHGPVVEQVQSINRNRTDLASSRGARHTQGRMRFASTRWPINEFLRRKAFLPFMLLQFVY
jgi:hypothetical protein